MWQGDLTFEFSCRAGWWQLIMKGDMPEAEVTFRGQLAIMRPKERRTILRGCCIPYTLSLVHAVLSVNWWSWHGEISRDDITLCSAMMVEIWTRQREMVMMMRTMWRIQADMRNQGYDLPDWVGKTSYQCNYTPHWDLYLPYRGWSIDSYTKFPEVPVSHDDLSHHLSSLSFSSSALPSPKNTKLSHPSLFLHTMIKS